MTTKVTDGISGDEIARLAYLKWESEGRPAGRSLQHWLDAEHCSEPPSRRFRVMGAHP
jgi:hypothetical protein